MKNNRTAKKLFNSMAILFSLLAFLSEPLFAQTIEAAKNDGQNISTNITAKNMRYEANKQQVRFEGSVKVRRPDFNLDSNKLTIIFKESKEASSNTDDPLSTMGGGDIDRMIAEGQVVLTRDGRKGTCGKVTYIVDKEMIVMEQNPVLSEGKSTVKGQKINFYIRENRSEVIGSDSDPVKVHFSSPKPIKGK